MSNVSGVVNTSQAYASTYTSTAKKPESKGSDKKVAEEGAVYEKSSADAVKGSGTYSINKMSSSDRSALVNQLKADQQNRQQQLISYVKEMMSGQANAFGQATDMWKFLASGNYEVDPETKAQAQEDISEDGYWGVKQTSQRLFDFASALAGDDVEKMEKMQKAIEKGFKLATKDWGQDLPSISRDTLDATNKMFEDYFASKKTAE